jgi:hypothetical protein
MNKIRIALLFLALTFSYAISAQNALIYGKVSGADGGLPGASITIVGSDVGTITDNEGKYKLAIPPADNITIQFSNVGYQLLPQTISLAPNEHKKINVKLTESNELINTLEIKDNKGVREGMITLKPKDIEFMPTPNMNLDISRIAIGVTGSADELSAQYSVRGGSFDENLVYVNDFEIYRPFLIRSGQQEGLTFPNQDLIQSLAFSSGGFQARYGDKLSSVLDIKYKRPDSLAASVGLSMLGGTAHIEGKIDGKNYEKTGRRAHYLLGARYKTTKYLLGSLPTKGEYTPSFLDIQSYIDYDLNKQWNIGWIANFNKNQFEFEPESRSTTVGLVNLAFRYNVLFQGKENDQFNTYMTGISLSHIPQHGHYYLKWLASTYQSDESEQFDITGKYLLGQIETDLGSSDAGEEIVATVGVGTVQNYTRNFLQTNVTNTEHKGGWERTIHNEQKSRSINNHLRWGLKYQHEIINDRIKEWQRLDSALYSLPYDTTTLNLYSVLKSNIDLTSDRYSAYLQHTLTVARDSMHEFGLTLGARAQWWSVNQELTITPRLQFYYRPLGLSNNIQLNAAVGLYYQPPFYREMRNKLGEVNTDLLAQKSLHAVLGLVYDFQVAKRTFRFITEAYYKSLWDLDLFDLDNVRIRYFGDNNAKGYATGIDFRLNGEFVPGAESYVNLSFLRTREAILGVQHQSVPVGNDTITQNINDVPRPTDQLYSFNFFFQDYLPKNENFKMHLNVVLGSGLPFGVPDRNIIKRNTYRYGPYHRVDVGFSALLWDAKRRLQKHGGSLSGLDKAWVSFEVFNLMGVSNEASVTWVKTIYAQQLAVPNYLTSRRLNLRLKVNF